MSDALPVAAAPVCARHPERVSYVRCQRCDQPVCPECMRPAAVGVQCATCVTGAAPSARPVGFLVRRAVPGSSRPITSSPGIGQAGPHRAPHSRGTALANPQGVRGLAASRWAASRLTGRPVVTYSFVGVCVAVFAAQLLSGSAWTAQLAFWPAIGALQPHRFVTAAFLHSTSFWGHIMFNMLALWQCGQLLERAVGHARFVALCLVTAVGGSVGYLLLSGGPGGPGWNVPVVGASGVVFGLFGALIPILRRTGGGARQIITLIAINAVIGFVVPGIAWQAHLGGLVVGLAVAQAFLGVAPQRRRMMAWAAPLAAIVLLAAVAWGYYEATGWLALVRSL